MSSKPITQFAYRSAESVALSLGDPEYSLVSGFTESEASARTFEYSKDGTYFGFASPVCVKVVAAETGKLVRKIDRKDVFEIGFSPKGTYISTWERPVKQEDGSIQRNLVVWDVTSGNELVSFSQKSPHNWNVQWTEDEAYFARLTAKGVHVFDSKRTDKPDSKLQIENLGTFALSPGRSPSIAVFTPEKKSAPASVRIFSLTNFKAVLAQKVFFKADKVQMKWNSLGTNLLVLTQTEVDKTNQSYYGETNLYLLAVAGNYDCHVVLDKEGPIHDIAWNPVPSSKEFIVVYGYIPSKATLFDHRANPVQDLGVNPRNTVAFNPHGRFFYIAGFGNLAGTIDVWDRKDMKKIATIEAPNTSVCAWSPDGRYIVTATLSPRLRVDNGYKIWHYSGVLVHAKDVKELYEVGWRPANAELYPMRASLSPPPKRAENAADFVAKPAVKPMGAYRPPHARGTATPSIFKREDEDPHAARTQKQDDRNSPSGEGVLTKAAAKNKKKRDAKKKKEEDTIIGESQVSPQSNVTGPSASLPVSGSGVLTEAEKKMRALQKKLRQIADLKQRQASGEKLEQTQMQKIGMESVLLKELEQLKT